MCSTFQNVQPKQKNYNPKQIPFRVVYGGNHLIPTHFILRWFQIFFLCIF